VPGALLSPGQDDEMVPMSEIQPLKARQDASIVALLLGCFLILTCISLTVVLRDSVPGHPMFWQAVAATLSLAIFIPLFMWARFSFGYILGVNFYCMIIGYTWYSYFFDGGYDHTTARWSTAASFLLLLLPLLFQVAPLRPRFTLPPHAMSRLLLALLVFAVVVLVWNAAYGFAFVSPAEAELLRGTISRPTLLSYVNSWLVGALLPFAFAWFATQRRYVLAALSIVLIAALYPVLLNKTVAFAAFWLPFLFLVFSLFEPRRAAVFSLLIPMIIGLIVAELTLQFGLPGKIKDLVFGGANYRMMAFPAIALDRYFDFFASHDLTHFCQIGIIRSFTGCPYQIQLGVEMEQHYHMGNLNGSLFATEGVASVGPILAPLSALACGLILSLGNSVSAHLPKRLVATSAGVAIQVLMNVPLSTSLLSNGLLLLFLVWYVTPATEDGSRTEA
jgi:hypothetical protein